jgi:hypothetical protein
VCVQAGRRCVVILANDVRAEPAFPALVQALLGDTGVPWAWEYPGMRFWPGPGGAASGAASGAPISPPSPPTP